MENLKKAMQNLDINISKHDQRIPVPFEEFLNILLLKPSKVIRNVFQIFYDMIKSHVKEGLNEYPDDPESINYLHYDFNTLFVEGSDNPFFADRIFANRLINLVDAMRHGAQQNKIYIFEGPHGCGKSTFLNNLLKKFEEYSNTEDGCRYETVWRLNRKIIGRENSNRETLQIVEKFFHFLGYSEEDRETLFNEHLNSATTDAYIDIPCPNHDNPILMIPKKIRREFFDKLLKNMEFKWKLFTEKEYSWVFKDEACTICTSLYQVLLNKLHSPLKIFRTLIYASPYYFNRRLGDGISVFNPSDKPAKESVLTNDMLQNRINSLLKDSKQIKYTYSNYAKTNNGIYALMDIKSNNTDRLIGLHNIISEGVHKVEEIEENVTSLFFALMNPEDKVSIKDFQSFSDRIEYINIPYVLDLNTEVEIYKNIFGKHIGENFLPSVLQNFAMVIIATRLKIRSEALIEWINNPAKYKLYCDENLQLLKMEIFRGHIPTWLSEEDRKRFTAKRRRNIIAESEKEGNKGFSGRDSIRIFNDFYSSFAKENKLINMSMLYTFFDKIHNDYKKMIPGGFLDALVHMYNYSTLQEVKESLYYYNEEQISKDIQNYLFAVNFEIGSKETCTFTGELIEINDQFFKTIENYFFIERPTELNRIAFRQDTQKHYASKTLPQEIIIDGKKIFETEIFETLHERYVHSIKEKVLEPFLENENFRRAIKDYGEEEFKTYDKRIRNDVSFLIKNLCEKYNYANQGAKEVCIYVIDKDLARKFSTK